MDAAIYGFGLNLDPSYKQTWFTALSIHAKKVWLRKTSFNKKNLWKIQRISTPFWYKWVFQPVIAFRGLEIDYFDQISEKNCEIMASFFDDEAEVGTTDEEDEMENDSKSIKVSKFGKKGLPETTKAWKSVIFSYFKGNLGSFFQGCF